MPNEASVISKRDLLALAAADGALEREFVSGEGAALFDAAGTKHINLCEIIACLGEGNKTFVSYMRDALGKVQSSHGNDLTYKRALIRYMTETTDNAFDRVLLTASGSEATEWAVKIAKKMTGRSEVISFWNSIHGRTHFSASMSGLPKRKAGYAPMSPGVLLAPYPDCLRCPFNREPKSCGLYCLEFLDSKIEYESAHDVAAVIIEPYQAAGNTFPPDNYLSALRGWADKRGILLIFDEVQSGMGRTGEMYRYQSPQVNVRPDIMVLGKALGNGLHIAAVLVKGEMEPKDVSAMAGGSGDSVLACAAACAVYSELLDGGLLDHIKKAGAFFKKGLLNLQARYPRIVQIRGEGLALAVDFLDRAFTDEICAHMRSNRLIFARNSSSVVFKPVYSITENQISEALNIMEAFLARNGV